MIKKWTYRKTHCSGYLHHHSHFPVDSNLKGVKGEDELDEEQSLYFY